MFEVPPFQTRSQVHAVALIFKRAALQIHNSQLGRLDHVGGVGSGWHECLWLSLCGLWETPYGLELAPKTKKKTRKTLADYKAAKTQRPDYVEATMSQRWKIVAIATERPPTWEECDQSAELFVYGVLLWSHTARSDLERLVLLSRTREFLFRDYIRSESGQDSLESAALRCTCVGRLLAEAARHESSFYSSFGVVPVSRGVYEEQDELAHLILRWWGDPKPTLLLYEAPPSSGKTTSVAFVATLLYTTLVATDNTAAATAAGKYILYACHSSYVREHLRLHLEAIGVPFAHIYAKYTSDSPSIDVCVALGKQSVRTLAPEKLTILLEQWTVLPSYQRPLVLLCDLRSATLVSTQRPEDLLFLDEVCETAFSHSLRCQIIEDAPQFLIILSSFVPPPHQVQEYIGIHERKWSDFTLNHIRSRRPQPSVTAFLSDGSVAMPHHFGVSHLTIGHYQHLIRFYSAAALKCILEEENLDALVTLNCGDLSSSKRVRRKCLQLIEDGVARTRRHIDASSDDEDIWHSFVWDAVCAPGVLAFEGVSLVYTETILECLMQGKQAWENAANIAEPPAFHGLPEIVTLAMRRGVAILSNDEEAAVLGISEEYNAWVLSSGLRGELVCILANLSVLHGLHLPFSRIFFWHAPSSFEASAHICGRVGRKHCDSNFTIYWKDAAAAAVAMIPNKIPK